MVLLDYLAHQRKLLPALATTYALQFAQDELVALMHDVQIAHRRRAVRTSTEPARAGGPGRRDQGGRHLARDRARSRPAARPAAARATSRRTCCPQLKADTDVFTTFEGDNTVLLQLVAKGLLTDYRDAFGDLDTLGMARFAAGLVGVDAVVERTGLRAAGRDSVAT